MWGRGEKSIISAAILANLKLLEDLIKSLQRLLRVHQFGQLGDTVRQVVHASRERTLGGTDQVGSGVREGSGERTGETDVQLLAGRQVGHDVGVDGARMHRGSCHVRMLGERDGRGERRQTDLRDHVLAGTTDVRWLQCLLPIRHLLGVEEAGTQWRQAVESEKKRRLGKKFWNSGKSRNWKKQFFFLRNFIFFWISIFSEFI